MYPNVWYPRTDREHGEWRERTPKVCSGTKFKSDWAGLTVKETEGSHQRACGGRGRMGIHGAPETCPTGGEGAVPGEQRCRVGSRSPCLAAPRSFLARVHRCLVSTLRDAETSIRDKRSL